MAAPASQDGPSQEEGLMAPVAASCWRLSRQPCPPGAALCPRQPPRGHAGPESTDGRAMDRFAILVGTALLLQVPGDTQALSNTRGNQLPTDLDFIKEIILGIRAVEPPEESEITVDAEPGIKVFSDAQAWRGPSGAQAIEGPEEDRDHLHHPEGNGVEHAAHVQRLALPRKVQSGPEEDRDHIHHGREEEM
ncbi:uncharacterized protein LOC112981618 isoform X2 [Dromaius novaehollandiae]|uniref:uncharacterized protein LOC112981618 isoform X2 n=1 Tax=Dromaius novaehollandiae TaxID=8790 RepID=UPI003120439E